MYNKPEANWPHIIFCGVKFQLATHTRRCKTVSLKTNSIIWHHLNRGSRMWHVRASHHDARRMLHVRCVGNRGFLENQEHERGKYRIMTIFRHAGLRSRSILFNNSFRILSLLKRRYFAWGWELSCMKLSILHRLTFIIFFIPGLAKSSRHCHWRVTNSFIFLLISQMRVVGDEKGWGGGRTGVRESHFRTPLTTLLTTNKILQSKKSKAIAGSRHSWNSKVLESNLWNEVLCTLLWMIFEPDFSAS